MIWCELQFNQKSVFITITETDDIIMNWDYSMTKKEIREEITIS